MEQHPMERRCEPLYAPATRSGWGILDGGPKGAFQFCRCRAVFDPPRARIVGLTNGIEAVQDGRIQVGKCPRRRSGGIQFSPSYAHGIIEGKPTPNALENFELGASAVIVDRNREEFEQLARCSRATRSTGRGETSPRSRMAQRAKGIVGTTNRATTARCRE